MNGAQPTMTYEDFCEKFTEEERESFRLWAIEHADGEYHWVELDMLFDGNIAFNRDDEGEHSERFYAHAADKMEEFRAEETPKA